MKATTAPRMRCFCEMGFYGAKCDQASRLSKRFSDQDLAADYETRKLGDTMDLYWKILELSLIHI